jgi:hypothetical protein
MQSSDFEIRFCAGSNEILVAQRLLETDSIALGVTESMTIWLTHKSSHWDILDDSGIPECDFVILGNISLGVGIFEYKGRNAVVRMKANQFTSWEPAITAAVDEFCRPLALKYRNAHKEL